ncbi:MAG: HipA domain-containing protein [Alphaproteobacteria bacterium]|nr:HipA domain-containing protein [Alphaproteobacteria bacterium]
MPLHLVGETIAAKPAHLRADRGELLQLIRGVYVDAEEEIDTVLLGHAVRIAHYLYPHAYLSSASAVLVAPLADGRLFISGRRNQRTRLRALEIVQNQAPPAPSLAPAVVGDDLGELRVQASTPRQRFLESFRLRSEHAAAFTPDMKAETAERLVAEYGSPAEAADALWALARENQWYREGEAAERYLLTRPGSGKTPANKAALELTVAWHGDPLGKLRHDGFEWRWATGKTAAPTLVQETVPGRLPPMIESLLPEGWLAQVLHERDAREALRQGRRYMSNITIAPTPEEIEALPADILQADLQAFTRAGAFTGVYAGPGRGELEESFEHSLAQLFVRSETPRLSGVQIKAPMCLTPAGDLVPAVDLPFTHILKPAGSAGFESLPVVEWICLQLAGAAGLEVPPTALAAMPDGMPPALVVQRFDIRRDPQDRRRLALEDMCAVLGVPAAAKYDATIERVGRGIRPLSTDPAADMDNLFRRALFAWLVADGDMHLKNLALLKVAPPEGRRFESVRLAPAYDAVCTRVFPGLSGDRMALKVAGKDDRLARREFLGLARTLDVPQAAAEKALDQMVGKVGAALAAGVDLPQPARDWAPAKDVVAKVVTIVGERISNLT